jgi:hypothetical protein
MRARSSVMVAFGAFGLARRLRAVGTSLISLRPGTPLFIVRDLFYNERCGKSSAAPFAAPTPAHGKS